MKDYENTPGRPLSFIKNMTKEDWQRAKTNLLGHDPKLTENDVAFEPGKEEEFIENLRQKTGKSRDEIIEVIMRGQREVPLEK